MFGGRFSLARFSLRGATELDARVDVFFAESVRSLISLGNNSAIENNYRENVRTNIIVTQGTVLSHSFRGNIAAVTYGVRDYPLIGTYDEQINYDIEMAADFSAENNYAEVIDMIRFDAVIETFIEQQFTEQINNQTSGAADFLVDGIYQELLNQETTLSAMSFIVIDYVENIDTDIWVSNNVLMDNQFLEEINAQIYMGYNHSFSHTLRDAVNSTISGGLDFPYNFNARESIFMLSTASMTDKDSFVINVIVPPGSELRIDSENYTVTLDGENIIHLHEGFGEYMGFIKISRETVDLLVDSGGTLNGEIIYQERYL